MAAKRNRGSAANVIGTRTRMIPGWLSSNVRSNCQGLAALASLFIVGLSTIALGSSAYWSMEQTLLAWNRCQKSRTNSTLERIVDHVLPGTVITRDAWTRCDNVNNLNDGVYQHKVNSSHAQVFVHAVHLEIYHSEGLWMHAKCKLRYQSGTSHPLFASYLAVSAAIQPQVARHRTVPATAEWKWRFTLTVYVINCYSSIQYALLLCDTGFPYRVVCNRTFWILRSQIFLAIKIILAIFCRIQKYFARYISVTFNAAR